MRRVRLCQLQDTFVPHEDHAEESDEEECEEYDSAYDLTEDTLVGLTRDT